MGDRTSHGTSILLARTLLTRESPRRPPHTPSLSRVSPQARGSQTRGAFWGAASGSIPNKESDRCSEILAPLFEGRVDPLKYACALLRVAGAEDEGWDTLSESVKTLREIHAIAGAGFPEALHNHSQSVSYLTFYLIFFDRPGRILAGLER